jgi:hypothetical protein
VVFPDAIAEKTSSSTAAATAHGLHLIYRENTGKFFDFEPYLRSARSETAVNTNAFFRNSLKFGTGK